jgi:anti-anti-sigma factor
MQMRMQVWRDGVILVELAGGAETSRELESVISHVYDQGECDVMVDFWDLTLITSRSLAPLLRLRNLLSSRGRRLVLCGLGQAATGVFLVTALDRIFEIVEDRTEALALIDASRQEA